MVMTFETFRHRDKIPDRLDAQLSLIRGFHILLRCCYGDQQSRSTTMFDFV